MDTPTDPIKQNEAPSQSLSQAQSLSRAQAQSLSRAQAQQSTDHGKQRKHQDIAALLPIAGVALLATPFISTIEWRDETTVLDIAIYIFCLWGGLIAASFWLSKILLPQLGRDKD